MSDLSVIQRRVEALGAVAAGELAQIDTCFDVPGRRLKLRELGDGTAELISYLRADEPGPTLSKYLVANVIAAGGVRDVLAHALGVRGVVRKHRRLFLLGQTRVHLDDVDGLGTFIELEVVLRDNQSETEGEHLAYDLLETLAIARSDLVARAYVDLLQDAVY